MITTELKRTNILIPNYVKNHLKHDSNNKCLCPICNKPLTYIEGANHIECETCQDSSGKKLIRGYVSLLMFNENLSFSEALDKAKTQLKSVEDGETEKSTIEYKDIDTREIGVNYVNKKGGGVLDIYETDYLNNALIFTDKKLSDLLFMELLSVMPLNTMPNILEIVSENYIYNAVSVLMKMKKNHKIKIYLIFENDKESNRIKTKLISDLHKYEFLNYILVDTLINHDNEHTIIEHAKRNKENFKYELLNLVKNFKAYYKRPILEAKESETDKDTTKRQKTRQNG